MNAVIIGVGNQKHRERFESCRDFIKKELTEVGAALGGFSVVSPQMGLVLEELREATRAGELVLVLPAPDPAAAAAVTAAVCQGLRLSPGVDQELARQLARRAADHDRDWDREQIEAFAAAPTGCQRIPNPTGMVQGYSVRATHQLLLVLPAVQSELTACFESTVRELLAEVGEGVTVQKKLRAVELGEYPVAALLEPLTESENPRVVLRPQGGECDIDIAAAGRTRTEAEKLCDGAVRQISQRLGPLLTSKKGEPLVQQVGRLLGKKHITLSVAEAGTDGALAAAVKAASGRDSKVLAGGMNLLTDAQKAERLGVSRKLLAEAGGTSRRVAAAMAVLVRRAAKSRLGLAIACGDPDRAGRERLAYIALTDGREVWAKKLSFPADASPEAAANAACLQALNMLRLYAQRFPGLLPGGAAVEHAAPGLMTGREKLSANLSWQLARFKGLFTGSNDDEENGGDENEAMELNLIQRIIQKKLTKGDGVRLGILGVSLAVFIGCLIYIGSVYGESHKNKGLIKDLQSLYGTDINPEDLEGFPEAYLPKFAALWAINEDIAGWIKIEGTQYIDMPVVQYYDNEYYERRDFNKQSNQHGVAFVDYRVAQREPSTNTIIYAHNMNDGQMFGELLNYKSVEYYRTHPLVQYDSVFYEGTWKIFAVVVCKKDDPDFLYHSFIDKKNDQEMIDFVTKVRERSILNTKVDVMTTDQLLTLSTCDYSFKSETGDRIARFVVFARKVRDGESTDVDTAGATINTSPVMPAEWYAYLQKQQEEELKRQAEEAAAAAANKWLTEEERQTLSAEEAQKLAESREKDAQEYLSYDERESEDLDLDAKLALIRERKAEFKLFLDKEEQKQSLSKRLELVRERRQLAEAAGLTEEDIEAAGDWETIRELIEGTGGAVLEKFIEENLRYLMPSDRSAGSLDALYKLIDQRKVEMAEAAERLNLNLNDYETYEEFKKAVEAAESGQAAADQADKDWEAVTKDPEKAKFLNESDKGMTKAQLEKLVQDRRAEYTREYNALTTQAARDALTKKIKNAKSWSDVLSAISNAQDVEDAELRKQEENNKTDPPEEPEEKEDPPAPPTPPVGDDDDPGDDNGDDGDDTGDDEDPENPNDPNNPTDPDNQEPPDNGTGDKDTETEDDPNALLE